MKLPLITADDWGFSPGVNEGILDLVHAKVIRNVAVTVNMPYWKEGLEDLKKVADLHFSLHLNFCFGPPLTSGSSLKKPGTEIFPNLAHFAYRWTTGNISKDELCAETATQIAELEDAISRPLIKLNGHQHCHLVPGVMNAILPILQKTNVREIRLPWDRALLFTAKSPILVLSALAKRNQLPDGFSWDYALYPLPKDFQSKERLQKKLSCGPEKEFLVHPAKREDFEELNVQDPYKSGRRLEYESLLKLAS